MGLKYRLMRTVLKCPQCQSNRITKHSQWIFVPFLFVLTLILFAIGGLPLFEARSEAWTRFYVFFPAGVLSLSVALLSAESAAVRQHKCKVCAAEWR